MMLNARAIRRQPLVLAAAAVAATVVMAFSALGTASAGPPDCIVIVQGEGATLEDDCRGDGRPPPEVTVHGRQVTPTP